MEYRTFPKGGDTISSVGIGGSKLHTMSENELVKLVDMAREIGVNIIDFASETMDVFFKMGKVLKSRRHHFMLGLHLGLTFQEDGQYKRTRNVDQVARGF